MGARWRQNWIESHRNEKWPRNGKRLTALAASRCYFRWNGLDQLLMAVSATVRTATAVRASIPMATVAATAA